MNGRPKHNHYVVIFVVVLACVALHTLLPSLSIAQTEPAPGGKAFVDITDQAGVVARIEKEVVMQSLQPQMSSEVRRTGSLAALGAKKVGAASNGSGS